MKPLILILFLVLSGCEGRPCVGPFPDYEYFKGEVALHIPTEESVRILGPGTSVYIGFTACEIRKRTNYTIRFSDGSEIIAKWNILEPMDILKPPSMSLQEYMEENHDNR